MNDCCEPSVKARKRALWRTVWIVGGVIALVLASTCLSAQDPALYLEGGVGHKQGDFGTSTLSKLNLAYGTVGYASSTFDLNVTVPVLHLTAQGGGVDASASGVGDVLLRGVHRFIPETATGYALDGGLALKLPTANSDKGLGTGKADVGGFLAIHQRWDRIQLNLLGGWIQSGSASGTSTPATRDGIYTAGVGLSYYTSTAKFSLGYEARGALYEGTQAPRDLSLDVFKMLSPKLAMKASLIAGLTDGSPKTSVGLGFVYWP
ncbi:hypothetical protein [Geothrix fuzhouensis]|uniref:hypothetical protein n=1 Tax=Geothrix fuzhouensis TaxID=2966451 RepID=UPI002149587E|nr:hypothetical protein [Geothrix fuzhouensis]